MFFSPTFVLILIKDKKSKYDYSEQKMDTADRDCRLYSVDGIVQTGTGCRSEIFLCSHADRTNGQRTFFSYSATIRGRQDIDIYPQVSGTIEKLCVTEGQKVRRGQLLFIIDQVPYRAALKTATANVEAARAARAPPN